MLLPSRAEVRLGKEALPQLWWHIARDLLSLGHWDSRAGEVEKLLGRTNLPSFLPEGQGKRHQAQPGGGGTLQKEIRLQNLLPCPHPTLLGALWSCTVQYSSHHLNLSWIKTPGLFLIKLKSKYKVPFLCCTSHIPSVQWPPRFLSDRSGPGDPPPQCLRSVLSMPPSDGVPTCCRSLTPAQSAYSLVPCLCHTCSLGLGKKWGRRGSSHN